MRDLLEHHQVDAIYLNRTYSPRGKERDDTLESISRSFGVEFFSLQDFLMVEPHELEQRKVFTPYSLLWKRFLLSHPERLEMRRFDPSKTEWYVPADRQEIAMILSVPYHKYWTLALGRERIQRDFSRYDDLRNLPAVDGSTRLSPYIRFGIFSIREIYMTISSDPTLLSEIIWREFWYQIAYYFPYTYQIEFQERRRTISWENDESRPEWVKFQKGET